jgi:predicted GH43/DUF377 family glycosyl hydrolase
MEIKQIKKIVMYKWQKLGHVFCPKEENSWMHSHAANTIAEHLNDDVFRIYFSCRDTNNRAHIGFIEIDIFNPEKILKISDTPVLSPGSIGLFDDSGASLSCIININGKKHMYYLGWNLGVTVPWRNSIGLAIEDEKGNYVRHSLAPLLDRCDVDPYSISYPFVLYDEGIYKMWYGSNLSWGAKQEEMAHLLKYAESKDGINWKREGRIALNFKNESEYAMSRPFVIKENGIYKMWYSYRGAAYRIGYAESSDALNWVRKDEEVGIDVSVEGWDSETIEYPFIFDHKGERYMLYNGNAYGKTGFGLAKLKK